MSARVRYFLTTLFFLGLVAVCGLSASPVQAQEDNSIELRSDETYTQPKERVVKVTASVNDNTPPSIPILIAPPNESLISDNTPTFVWKGSYDEFGISHYILTLDGKNLFENIPTSGIETADFILTYDASQHYYSLTPKATISDGTHTWKVTAVDSYDNTASSVTWTFMIDSQSPVFVITDVDGQEQSISAQDANTVPTEPIVLTNNEPILAGTGEAKSTVDLTVRLPDGTTTTYTFTISDDGKWEVQLGILPRDKVIYLDFKITDQVGHISVLEDVPLILKTKTIVIPPIPFFPPPEEPIIVPIPPPEEVIPEIIEVIPPEIIPQPIAQVMALFPVITATPKSVGEFSWGSILVLILISTLPFLKTLLLAGKFGTDFALSSLLEIWKVIGLVPYSKPQGIVVYQDSQEPVAFAKVITSGKLNDYHHVTETHLTNTEGLYSPSGLANGVYQLNVLHPQTLFPSMTKISKHLTWSHYYQGQEFQVDDTHPEPHLVVPVDHRKSPPSRWEQTKHWLLTRRMSSTPMLITAILITVFAFSYLNLVATIFYTVCLWATRPQIWRKRINGTVISPDKTPLHNVVALIFNYQATQLLAIRQSSEKGSFICPAGGEKTRLWAVDFSYKLDNTTKINDVPTDSIVIESDSQRSTPVTLIMSKVE